MADTEQQPASTLEAMQQEAQALDAAIARANEELQQLSAAAADAEYAAEAKYYGNAEIREVPGVGRYAIPTRGGWEALIEVIQDKSADVNYSPVEYPVFDGIIQNITQNSFLDDPDQPQFASHTYIDLRDNIAAVRNFLMETYYSNTPAGMSAADAKKALQEIATFLGEGLHNNLRMFGLIPNHNPGKHFIDISLASQPHGEGAQYLYREILRMQRDSSWKVFFGGFFGHAHDWHLPSALATPFMMDMGELAEKTHELEDAAAERLLNLQAEREALEHVMEDTEMAVDLEAIGNQLLETAEHLNDVTQLSEKVLDEAIEYARNILKNLRIVFGDKLVVDGLRMTPEEDRSVFRAVQGVAMLYERVLAWGRGIDPSIAQHPSVMAATQAVGQLGYLTKMEALRVATAVGNTVLANRIAARIAALPAAYKNTSARSFSELVNRVEGGINTVLDRIQTIQGPGAGVGHTPYKALGSYMSGAPIAGLAMQMTNDGSNRNAAGKRNAEIMAAEEAAAQATAARINSQSAARAQQLGQQATPVRPARGQQAVQQARRQAASTSTTSTTNTTAANVSAQQRAALLRQAAFRAAHGHDHDEEHDGHHAPQRFNPTLANPGLQSKIQAAKISSSIQNAPIKPGTPVTGYGFKPAPVPNLKATPDDTHDHEHDHSGGPKGSGHTR